MDYTYLQQRFYILFQHTSVKRSRKYTDLAAQHAQNSNDIFVAFHTWQLRSGIKVEVNKLDEAEYSIRKAWEIACQAGNNSTTWKIRCMPSLLRIFEKKEQADSVNWYLQLGNKLLKEIPSSGIAAIGYIQVRASMEMKRGNYAKALQDLLWLRKRNTGSEPKTLLTQIAQCYDAVGNKQLAYIYMDSARMWTDTLAQHNLTQKWQNLMSSSKLRKRAANQQTGTRETGTSSFPAQSLRMRRMPAGYRIDSYTDITLQKRMAERKIKLLQQEMS